MFLAVVQQKAVAVHTVATELSDECVDPLWLLWRDFYDHDFHLLTIWWSIDLQSLLFSPNAVPAPESHRSVASLTLARSWQSHIPFGSLFSFQGTMKRSFTYSHWEKTNDNPKRENISEWKTSSLIWTKGAEMHTHFEASPKNFLRKFIPSLVPTGKYQIIRCFWKFFIW